MTVDASISVMYDRVASRERDTQHAFVPGAVPENSDVAASHDGARVVFDPLSVALPQNSYAIVSDANGKRLYTRDGAFHVQDSRLVDATGNLVQGYANPRSPLGPIEIDRIDVRLDRVRDVRIESNGSFTYARTVIDPRTGERLEQRVNAGRIALARFPAGSSLHAVDSIHSTAPNDVIPHIGVSGDGNFGKIEPNRLTKSHIDLDASLIKLQESYLAFDALRAAKQAHAATQKTAIDLIK